MAVLKAFRGVRYNLEKVLLKQVITPPYDVISPAMREDFISRSPHNIVNIDLPIGGVDRYHNAAILYHQWRKEDYLIKDDSLSYYLYEQDYTYGGKKYIRSGFFSTIKLSEFGEGIVFPHEKTHAGPKIDRYELMKSSKSNFSSIFGLYIDSESRLKPIFTEIKRTMPDASSLDDDSVKHSLWRISDPTMIDVITKFMIGKSIYIADGHHRYETAIMYRDDMRKKDGIADGIECSYDYVLMMLVNFEDEGLRVFPTHRVIDVHDDYDEPKLILNLTREFDIDKLSSIDDVTKFLELNRDIPGKWCFIGLDGYYSMSIKEDIYNKEHNIYRDVYTYLLENKILKPEFNFTDEKLSHKNGIEFMQDIEAINQYRRDHRAVAFILNPESLDTIRKVSESELVMPQKSTYFYPKLATGLIINEF